VSLLRIVKGSRREVACRRCHKVIALAMCLTRQGPRTLPIAATAFVIREERNSRDVVFEVIGGDQVHRCHAKTSTRQRPAARLKPWTSSQQESTSTPDRIAELRAAVHQPARRDSGRLW